VIGV